MSAKHIILCKGHQECKLSAPGLPGSEQERSWRSSLGLGMDKLSLFPPLNKIGSDFLSLVKCST